MTPRLATILLLCLLGVSALAGNVIGPVSGQWSIEESPILIVGDTQVPPGQTLIIDPGVEIRVRQNVNFTIYGTLRVIGSADNPVTIGGYLNASWGGFLFAPTDTTSLSSLEYAHITNAYVPITANSAKVQIAYCHLTGFDNAVHATQSQFTALNSTLEATNFGRAITVKGIESNMVLRNDTIIANSFAGQPPQAIALHLTYGVADVSSNRIYANSSSQATAMLIENQENGIVERNHIRINCPLDNVGVHLNDLGPGVRLYSNTIRFMSEGYTVTGIKVEACRGVRIRNNVLWGQGLGAGLRGVNPAAYSSDFNLIYFFNRSHADISRGENDLFVDPRLDPITFAPQSDSPVINAGDPQLPLDPDGTRADIGAMYYPLLSVSPEVALPTLLALQSWPNPFNSVITFSLPASGSVSWTIYDCTGRAITSGQGTSHGSVYTSQWSPMGVATGTYMIEVKTSTGVARRTLSYLR